MGKVIASRRVDRLDPRGTCHGKAAYPSGVLAARIARRSKYAGTQPYRCPFCGSFHIGGRPASAKTRRMREL